MADISRERDHPGREREAVMTDDRQTADDEQLRESREAFEAAVDERRAGNDSNQDPAEDETSQVGGSEGGQPTGS
jgi:hypothetical protein